MSISFVLSYPSLLFVCTIPLRACVRACCVHLGYGLGLPLALPVSLYICMRFNHFS
jgi:hypothetical protein